MSLESLIYYIVNGWHKMANYQETTSPSTTWKRANQVIINNPLGSNTPKLIRFFEETVVVVGENTFQASAGNVSTLYKPDSVINLRDPATGQKTGNVVNQSLVYQALYSLYLDIAEARDAGVATPDGLVTINNQLV